MKLRTKEEVEEKKLSIENEILNPAKQFMKKGS
jgi:hypothetical protein